MSRFVALRVQHCSVTITFCECYTGEIWTEQAGFPLRRDPAISFSGCIANRMAEWTALAPFTYLQKLGGIQGHGGSPPPAVQGALSIVPQNPDGVP